MLGAENFQVDFDDDEFDIAREIEAPHEQYGCTQEFLQIVTLLFDNVIPSPDNPTDAYRLHLEIMREIQNLDDA